jgi:RNA recognition motif-containing protein
LRTFLTFNQVDNVETRIYVGNLPFNTTDAELAELFTPYGVVKDATIIRYRESKRSKGYAFIKMKNEDATKAISALNDSLYLDRTLKICLANKRTHQSELDQSKIPGSIRFAID